MGDMGVRTSEDLASVPLVMAEEMLVNASTIMVAHSGSSTTQDSTTLASAKNEYEVISGLMVQLSDDAKIDLSPDGVLNVRAATASLLEAGSHAQPLVSIQGVCLQGRLAADSSELQDLVVSMENTSLDPLTTREKVLRFVERFGLPKASQEATAAPTRSTRMNQEEWQQFLANAQRNTTVATTQPTVVPLGNIESADQQGVFSRLDRKIPHAQVKSFCCQLPNRTTMDFTHCQGSQGATLRTLLEYYFRSILNQMDLLSGDKAGVSISAVASDVASVKASVIAASVGSVFLGPAGFVAGGYLGSKWMRQSSSTVNGGAAGLVLFGPVGLVAGAMATSNDAPAATKPIATAATRVDDSGNCVRKSVVQATADHVAANKYEYAGSTGVIAGAAAGMAVAGPIGLVVGSLAGSVSGRKLVESTTAAEPPQSTATDAKKPYRLGDFSRGIVARGKESRSANREEGYRFGDFTRGLFS